MREFFGEFSWPIFINSAFPIYLTAFATMAVVYVAWRQASAARKEAAERAARVFLDKEFSIENHQLLPNLVKKYCDFMILLPISIQGATPLDEALDENLHLKMQNDREVLMNFISRRELLADAIDSEAVNLAEIHRMMGSKLIWEWSVLEVFVQTIRQKTNLPDYFHKYESLIQKMKKIKEPK